jgi:hypothetical protein
VIGVVSVMVFAVGFPSVWRGWFLDTSEATAKKIQSGMTLAEASSIIGGSPGNYTLNKYTEFRRSFNGITPNITEWRTYQGTITVCDGYQGGHVPPKGTVDWVEWKSPKPGPHNPWLLLFIFWVGGMFVYWVFFGAIEETDTNPP